MIKKVIERSSAFVVIGRRTLIIGMMGVAVISFALGYFFGGGGPSSEKFVKHVEAVSKAVPPEEKTVPDSTGKPAEATKKPEPGQPRAEYQERTAEKPKGKARQRTGEKKLSGKSYALQLGSFRDPQKARLLKEELDSKGYRAYILSYAPAEGKAFLRVRIGPYDSREPAAAIIPELKKQGFVGAIVPEPRQA